METCKWQGRQRDCGDPAPNHVVVGDYETWLCHFHISVAWRTGRPYSAASAQHAQNRVHFEKVAQ